MCLVANLDGNLWKVSYSFVQTYYFFIQNKTNGVLGWQICNFDQKLKTHWIFGWQSKNFGGRCVRSEMKEGVLKTLEHTFKYGSVPPGSNYIKILIVLKIYEWYWFLQHLLVDTSAQRNILSAHAKVEISSTRAKVLNSDIYLCTHSKPHLQKYLIDWKRLFLHKLPKVKDILNLKRNFKYGGHMFTYGRWFSRTRSFWDTQYVFVIFNGHSICLYQCIFMFLLVTYIVNIV